MIPLLLLLAAKYFDVTWPAWCFVWFCVGAACNSPEGKR